MFQLLLYWLQLSMVFAMGIWLGRSWRLANQRQLDQLQSELNQFSQQNRQLELFLEQLEAVIDNIDLDDGEGWKQA